MQPARADAIGAALVFLDLLKSEPDGLAELFLGEAKHVPPKADARAHAEIDDVRTFGFLVGKPSPSPDSVAHRAVLKFKKRIYLLRAVVVSRGVPHANRKS
jgi:hypothetical protein